MGGKYTVQFDFWLNYHINGSTEEGGGAVGVGSGGGPLSGTGLLVNTEGDSATDYKLLNAGALLGIDSGMYAIPSLDAQDAANTAIQAAFASQTAPATQGIAPTFQWRNLP
jgi:DNA replicative helicase MCM subunit Mcm2 (Cdc46/Mcm family)